MIKDIINLYWIYMDFNIYIYEINEYNCLIMDENFKKNN